MDVDFDNEIVIVVTTESNFEKAELLANTLLEKRYAACVNFNEIKSSFIWKDKIENTNEVKLIIKTSNKKLIQLLKEINQSHSYEIPELIFWKVSCSNDYFQWVKEVT